MNVVYMTTYNVLAFNALCYSIVNFVAQFLYNFWQ